MSGKRSVHREKKPKKDSRTGNSVLGKILSRSSTQKGKTRGTIFTSKRKKKSAENRKREPAAQKGRRKERPRSRGKPHFAATKNAETPKKVIQKGERRKIGGQIITNQRRRRPRQKRRVDSRGEERTEKMRKNLSERSAGEACQGKWGDKTPRASFYQYSYGQAKEIGITMGRKGGDPVRTQSHGWQ